MGALMARKWPRREKRGDGEDVWVFKSSRGVWDWGAPQVEILSEASRGVEDRVAEWMRKKTEAGGGDWRRGDALARSVASLAFKGGKRGGLVASGGRAGEGVCQQCSEMMMNTEAK